MQGWDTFTGLDPLPLTLPQGPAEFPDDQGDWLPQPQAKAGFDEFGPMFGSEGEDGGVFELPPGEVTAETDDPYDEWWETGSATSTGGNSSGGSGGGSQDPTGLIDNMFAWLDGILDRFGDSATELANRDANSTFDRSQAQPLYRDGRFVGYIDFRDNSFWYDRNGNGQPETHLRWFGNELWQDTNFDGGWDRRVR